MRTDEFNLEDLLHPQFITHLKAGEKKSLSDLWFLKFSLYQKHLGTTPLKDSESEVSCGAQECGLITSSPGASDAGDPRSSMAVKEQKSWIKLSWPSSEGYLPNQKNKI